MKRNKTLLMAVAAIPLCFSSAINADAAVEKRVEMLEKELAALKTDMKSDKPAVGKVGNTAFSFGGFIKADAMWSEHSDQQRAANVGDDFLVPSTIATGDGTNEGDTVFDAHAKTSRIWFKAVTDLDVGSIKSFIEMDFNASSDERLTNQSSNGLRHAFVDWSYSDTGSILAGQTWSTFFNVGALPETVDFIGPTSGTIFIRQEQLRWTKKLGDGSSLMLAAENPSTSLNDGGSGLANNKYDDNGVPDLVARYNGKVGSFSYSAAVIAREIAYDDTGMDDSDNGVAVSVAGKWVLSNGDDFKFMVSSGTLGRYLALNAFRDGAIEADGSIDLLDVTGGFVAYRHHWSSKWRSTVSYAMAAADNPNSTLVTMTESISNANVNIIYSPIKKLSFGAEYIMADRELESGEDGDLDRLQFMAKYVF